jgi:cysteine protease ATG4
MNDLERVGRHIVRTFYDPPPTRDEDTPIWCLGERYEASTHQSTVAASRRDRAHASEDDSWIRASLEETDAEEINAGGGDPSSARSYGGWPPAFLDDFESRIWMTYRSGFTPIPKSQDPKAAAAMSFRVRLQNLSQPAFSSDTGFGCMIRSGQSVLANTLASLRLGRGGLSS